MVANPAAAPRKVFGIPMRIKGKLLSIALLAERRGTVTHEDGEDEDGAESTASMHDAEEEPVDPLEANDAMSILSLSSDDAPYDENTNTSSHASETTCDSVVSDQEVSDIIKSAGDPPPNERGKTRRNRKRNHTRRNKHDTEAAAAPDSTTTATPGFFKRLVRRIKTVARKALQRGTAVAVDVDMSDSAPMSSKHHHLSGIEATAIPTVTFPVASTGFVARNMNSQHAAADKKRLPLEAVTEQRNMRVMEWDGCDPRAIVDSNGKVIVLLAGQPRNRRSWRAARRQAEKAMKQFAKEMKASGKRNRRGPHKSGTTGISFGGGQTKPKVIALGENSEAFKKLIENSAIQRISGFITSAFQLYAPKLHEDYHAVLNAILEADPTLAPAFENSVFAATTFNLGPRTETVIHTDHLNYAPGWCAVMALGNFNPKKGGHLVLWDLELVIEFPPGSLIFLPSAILRHSNTTVGANENRMSFTQFTAGGLFRWVECGMKSQKDFDARGESFERTPTQRWLDGLARLPSWDSLVAMAS